VLKKTAEELHFEVSSGLKRVLGSELITDDEVAIFELVKNSFDADASLVNVYFSDDTIIIADDGNGMSYEDIRDKWLFVAFSAKREVHIPTDFRDVITNRHYFAGSKGIGRFSSDRLGRFLRLQTRPKSSHADTVHSIEIDWELFDADQHVHFGSIGVVYNALASGFEIPKELPVLLHGTVVTITGTRSKWDREKIRRLKSSLAKLINPFGSDVDRFKIVICAPSEVELDRKIIVDAEKRQEIPSSNALINGEVGNFIFSTLQEKTTFITVTIDKRGENIDSMLVDRGELIYKIREPNMYDLLKNSGFRCQIFFLNQSAKVTFARRMGVPSVQFGSVFLFRNGFRVFPIGEEGDDWFGIDRRKQQGYARFLGTRDVIGRIDVSGAVDDFQESSSRDTGLIATPAVSQLKRCFRDHCLIRLERYVVPVTFVDKEDKNTSDVSRLLTDPGRARVASVVAKLVDNEKVELIEYSKRLIGILNERSNQFEASLISLRAIAAKTRDNSLFQSIEEAERRFDELRRAEEAAKRQADEERRAKEAAQARAAAAELAATRASEQLEEEKRRNLFLASISNLDVDIILNLHHQITIYSVDIQQQIENFLVRISDKKTISSTEVMDTIEHIALLNRRIMGISKFATKANFRLRSEKIEADLGEYIVQYIEEIERESLLGALRIEATNDNKGYLQTFKPIDISIIIDNLVTNARKARASMISFDIVHPTKNSIHIHVRDNGRGLDARIEEPSRIFEKGFTTTDGSGLGLYHIRHVLGEMNGTIELKESIAGQGATFLIRIAK
jgi:hypothetical protein